MNDLERASIQAWNDRLKRDLIEPRLARQRKRACKARKQARYRRDLLASLHAVSSKAFVPKIIKRPASASSASSACMQEQASPKKQS